MQTPDETFRLCNKIDGPIGHCSRKEEGNKNLSVSILLFSLTRQYSAIPLSSQLPPLPPQTRIRKLNHVTRDSTTPLPLTNLMMMEQYHDF